MKTQQGPPIKSAPDALGQLTSARGVVVRQKKQVLEAIAQSLGVAYEASNKYVISTVPADKQIKNEPHDPNGWEPSHDELLAMEPLLIAQEESSCCNRFFWTFLGARNLRPLTMHFAVDATTGDVYVVDKKARCGGFCCCPMEMDLFKPDTAGTRRPIGRVRENFSPYFAKCCAVCCAATVYHDIERAIVDDNTNTNNNEPRFEKQFELRANLSCCGRVNNCCGATCCKNDMVFDILDLNGNVVAHLQKTFGKKDCCASGCRMLYQFDTFLLEFPPGTSLDDRMLLLTSVFQLEYAVFEKQNDQ